MSLDEDKMLSKLDSALDVKPAEEEKLPEVKSQDEKNTESDYEYTRKKLKHLMDTSDLVLEHAADVATETGEPRAIEVYATLVKNMSDIAKGVMENSKLKSAIDKDRGQIKHGPIMDNAGGITQNNQTIFVGSTRELLNAIKAEQAEKANAKNDDDDVIEAEVVAEEK